jgi:hypothetical protein
MQSSAHSTIQVRERIHPVNPTYEPGMKITYDQTSKRVVVAFRGRITVLPETYETDVEGLKAGEKFCRKQGWNPAEQGKPKKTFFKSWF